MKLSFVGAALLISVLSTDAQGYPGSQGYNVPANYNPQLPESGYNGYRVDTYVRNPNPQYAQPAPQSGYNGYRVDTYVRNPNPQYAQPAPQSSPFSDMISAASSFADNALNMMGSLLGMPKKLFGVQSDPSYRPYPYNSQASAFSDHYNGPPLPPPPPPPPPFASSQVFVSSYPYNQPGNNQVGAPSNHYRGPPPPPPPPFASSQVGASSNQYNDPSPPVASIQVTGASDSKNGPPPANSQLYNVRVPVPPQNAM